MAKDELKRNAREANKITKQSKSRSAKRIRKLTKMKERLASQKEHSAKGANRVWLRDMKDPLVRRDASIANESARIADHGGSQKDRKRFEQKALKSELKEKYGGAKKMKKKKKSRVQRKKPARVRVSDLDDYYHPESTEQEAGEKTKRGKAYDKQSSRAMKYWHDRARPDPLNPKQRSSVYSDAEKFSYEVEDKKGRQGEDLIDASDRKRAKLRGAYGAKSKHKERIKMVKEQSRSRKPPGNLGNRGSANLKSMKVGGLAAIGAMLGEEGVRRAYPIVKKRIKRNQDTAHRRRVERQDKRLMKKYKKKDPKKQAVFKKLMSKKATYK